MGQRLKGITLGHTQLRDLAVAARANAGGLITEARLLLDNEKVARAHALSVLGLEEAGKIGLCLGALLGVHTSEKVLASWDTHTDKLEQSHLLALLYLDTYPTTADVARRLDAAVRADAARKLRGLYVDPTHDGIATPADISEPQAREMVRLAEAVLELLQQMDLTGALERFSGPDAELARRVMRDTADAIAATRAEVEAMPPADQRAAEDRMRDGLDDLVGMLRSELIVPNAGEPAPKPDDPA